MVTAEVLQKLSLRLKPLSDEQGANAAVALILKPNKGLFDVLLVKRAINARDVWAGQMALPGGKREPEDLTLQSTVIRETKEEIGINIANNRFLGVLKAVKPMTGSGFLVLPFVVELERSYRLRLNCKELESYLWVPYQGILSRRSRTLIPGVGEVPTFLMKNAVVWGMTYYILNEFSMIIENPTTQ